mmetsp:Transcript_23501/g.67732  ORF Transcript_23501/g.67732 Transcript_23501/m.67732 type:complete len:905 (-) Transcript_23501:165-2879(-)|eukprot:CAMPEP_0181031822 /NCGR_PEP_ID=MMETSP1070-20121207/6429_1 /TAXON_ID=265543 /ORGANISM="Minutocellus polymorphus, Strain NH13" /LENGTH=904 /DNA_ID=CAMNT_0023109209 /DNA_START=127 /DNA_END=2841 /DNA_ORIENTATION=-
MAPDGSEYGDSDEDDGFDDDVPVGSGGGGGGNNNNGHQDEENPFTAFAAAHAKAARRRARTPDSDAAMADVDLDGGGGGDDSDDDGLNGTEHDNPFSSYAVSQGLKTNRSGGSGGGGHKPHADNIIDEDDDSSDDDIEDVTPTAPAPLKYGGSARRKPTGWGGNGGGGGAASDDETAVTAITANTSNTTSRKTKKFAGTTHRPDVEEDYGTGLFTISDDRENEDEDEDEDDDAYDEPFGDCLVKDMPRRGKLGRMDSKDSAYEDASEDDDDGGSSTALDDPSPFAKYTGEEEEDEENPFGNYVSKATRRAARQKHDEELMDDLFPEDTAAGGHGGAGHGGGGGHNYDEEDDDDEYDGLDDDEDSPRNAKSKDSGAGTTPTGMISYDKDFDDADYDLDGLDENYGAIKAYEKRRGMLTNRQWAVVLAIVTCIFVLLMIIIGLSVALASSNKKNGTGRGDGSGMEDDFGGSIEGQLPPARPHVVAQSYLQTYSGQDIETMESTAMIKRYEELMASYLTYYVGDDGTNLESVQINDEEDDGGTTATLTYIDGEGNNVNLPYTEGTGIEVADGQTLVFGGNVGGGSRHRRRSLILDMESVTVKCTFNFQRLSSSAARNLRHQVGGGRERRQLWRGLRRRRAEAVDLPLEVLDVVSEIDDGTLSVTPMAPSFYDDGDGSEPPDTMMGSNEDADGGDGRPPMANPSAKPSCPPGLKAVRDSSGRPIGCTPASADENLPTSAVGPISDMVIIDGENPPDELDGEAAIATATALGMMTAEEEDSMHLKIDFTMTWSASRHRSTQGEDKDQVDDINKGESSEEDKILRDLNNFPKRFEDFMNSKRGKRQHLHDLTKILELEVEVISDVVERETLKNKFTDVPTIAPTPAPSAATSSQPTPKDGCCLGVCFLSC